MSFKGLKDYDMLGIQELDKGWCLLASMPTSRKKLRGPILD
jgi:hypothetical protein